MPQKTSGSFRRVSAQFVVTTQVYQRWKWTFLHKNGRRNPSTKPVQRDRRTDAKMRYTTGRTHKGHSPSECCLLLLSESWRQTHPTDTEEIGQEEVRQTKIKTGFWSHSRPMAASYNSSPVRMGRPRRTAWGR